jgi:hypothetical protein
MPNIPAVQRPQDDYINSVGAMLQGGGTGNTATAVPTPKPKPVRAVSYGNPGATSPKQQYINNTASTLGAYKYADDPTVFGNYKGTSNYAFTSAKEFQDAGGNFKDVQTIQRPTVATPPPSPVSAPTINNSQQPQPSTPAVDRTAGYKDAYSAYLTSLTPKAPDSSVSDAQKKYLDFVTSEKLGENALEGQGRAIPLALVRGEQAKLGQQAELEANRLQGDIGIAQGNITAQQQYQKALQEQAAARLGYEQNLLDENKPIEVGGNLIQLNSTTGKYETVYGGGAKPTEVSAGGTLVDPTTGKVIFQGAPKPENLPASAQEYEYAKSNGYKGTYEQYQNEDANRKRSIVNVNAGGGGLSPGQVNTTVNQIASGFDNEPVVREYNTVANTLAALKNAGTSPTDDIQRIYAFAKIADPSSAVKEGEYKTIQDYSTAVLQRLGINIGRVFSPNGFLTDQARSAMSTTLNNILKAKQSAYDQIHSEYQRQIDDAYSGKPRQLTNYGQPSGAAPVAGRDPLGIR